MTDGYERRRDFRRISDAITVGGRRYCDDRPFGGLRSNAWLPRGARDPGIDDRRIAEMRGTTPARIAPSMAAVMLVGESGRGRKWRWSCCAHARAGKPFVSVNCGAIPANLVEAVSGY